MKRAQIIVAGLAVVAGIGAFMLSGGTPKTVVVEKPVQVESKGPPMEEVLVVTKPVEIGAVLNDKNLAWRPWPKDSVNKLYISKATNPKALEEYKGAISRYPLLAGDPVNTARVAKDKQGGVMSALLPKGKRAVAIPLSTETGAGGFILPNDNVDIMLTRKQRVTGGTSADNIVTETILSNIRVLAIDQTIQEKEGEKAIPPQRTATLELTPREAETLAMARQLGEISLILRSLADIAKQDGENDSPGLKKEEQAGSITVVRSGVQTQVPVNRK